jgi:hypothetical protein
MSSKATSNVGLRLTERYSDALKRYAEQVQKELQKVVPNTAFSTSAAARSIIEKFLDESGLMEPEQQERQPAKGKQPSTTELIIAEYKAGYTGTGSALAAKYGCNEALVSRAKSRFNKGE